METFEEYYQRVGDLIILEQARIAALIDSLEGLKNTWRGVCDPAYREGIDDCLSYVRLELAGDTHDSL